MRGAKSATKTVGSETIGIIPYKVVRTGPRRVSIILSHLCARMLGEQGADLSTLDNLGGRRARKVMSKLINSIDKQ